MAEAQHRTRTDDRARNPAASASATEDVVLALDGVTHVFETKAAPVRAVDDVTAEFRRGTWTAIMGPSGSGKSTLLYCAAGLIRATAGRILLGGVDVRTASERRLTELRRRQLGFVFQDFNLIPALTAEQNVGLPARFDGHPAADDAVRASLERVGLGDKLQSRPDALSGGQRQRVAIARALLTRPAVVIADEPTGALDSRSGEVVLRELTTLTDEGSAVVMVTHDPVVAAHADRTLFLIDGRLVEEVAGGSPATIARTLAGLDTRA
ncbi:ABC transporter ATP-binding protein [Cellulomonas sp. PS-H5]|uniref:ABC transporter ATP-binding protein n=1 Tax=Cellulomonas sp. PS-H5 TaxID=2820400 RepID=UPI001C4FCFCC|nr:ABC transporter ATP-binding protein [Cellulomonas sp. PS-H5]MBW0252452.1 ABC transporter ATP-binding protein [Cellulomonas sp. PS-H5]